MRERILEKFDHRNFVGRRGQKMVNYPFFFFFFIIFLWLGYVDCRAGVFPFHWMMHLSFSYRNMVENEKKTQAKQLTNHYLSHERGSERSEQASERKSGASERANGRASGPVLQSVFFAVIDHNVSDVGLPVRPGKFLVASIVVKMAPFSFRRALNFFKHSTVSWKRGAG